MLTAFEAEQDQTRPEFDRFQREGEDAFYRADYTTAMERFQRGLERADAIGSLRYRGQFLTNVGVVYRNLGQDRRALENYEQALAIHREIGDRRGEGADLSNIGLVHHSHGDQAQGREYLQRALAIQTEVAPQSLSGASGKACA